MTTPDDFAAPGDRHRHDDLRDDRDRHEGRDPLSTTLHAEQLRAGTETREVGRVRFGTRVVTETVQVPVQIRREILVAESADGQAVEGADVAGGESRPRDRDGHGADEDVVAEVVLHEERPVVSVETIPVERVRLLRRVRREEVAVTDTVRREVLDTDVDGHLEERR